MDGRPFPGNELVNPAHVELLVVVGADGDFELLEDDDTATGPLGRTRITYDQDNGALVIGPARGGVDAVPVTRSWTVTFPALDAIVDPVATADGAPIPARIDYEDTRTSVTVEDVPATAALRIHIGGRPRLRRNDVAERLFTMLDRAQIEYLQKTQVLDCATSARPLAARLSVLQAMGLADELFTAVGEILLAKADDPPRSELT
jgi:hypothetical protein